MPLSITGGIDQGDLALSLAHMMRDDLACAVLLFNRDQCVLSHSPNLPGMLDLQVGSLVGAHASTLPVHLRDLVQRTTQSGKSSCDTEFLTRGDQPSNSLRLTALPMHEADSNGVFAILVQDLSPVRRLEDDMRQCDRLASVGTLAAEMAHEIKNALVAVKTFVDLAIEKDAGVALGETVQRELKRMDSIVAQVLKFSRITAPASKNTSLHAVLDRTMKMMKPHFDGRNITVVTRLATTPDTVHGDENHLEQAFINLLLNAAEAMNSDGTLSIETDLITTPAEQPQFANSHHIRILIRDTGCGIPTESMTRLFEPFYSTKKNGTGLGLAITQRIIHEHHGIISAESEPGKGAAFQILLPAHS